MEELQNAIFSDLKEELGSEITDENEKAFLLSKVRTALNDVFCCRNYQEHHSEGFIEKDMKRMKPIIKRLALYDWNTVGAEFHKSFSENGISRSFVNRDDILSEVIPFVTVLSNR